VRLTIAGAVMALSASAAAAEIRWTGDVACRRELEVAEQVTSMTGRQLSSIDGADFRARRATSQGRHLATRAENGASGRWHAQLALA
jgi:hypothetical protein